MNDPKLKFRKCIESGTDMINQEELIEASMLYEEEKEDIPIIGVPAYALYPCSPSIYVTLCCRPSFLYFEHS